MTVLFSFSSISLALLAALTPLLPAFIPLLGLMPIYRMRPIRATLMTAAWVLVLAALLFP